MKKVNKNIFLFFDHVAKELVHGNRTIETVTKIYLMFGRNGSTNFLCLQ